MFLMFLAIPIVLQATNAFLLGFFPLIDDELKISKAASNFSMYSEVSLADAGKCPCEINVLIAEATEKLKTCAAYFTFIR